MYYKNIENNLKRLPVDKHMVIRKTNHDFDWDDIKNKRMVIRKTNHDFDWDGIKILDN